jgi:glycine/D-amino acid oxidase-like deaminating enzyme
MRYSIFSLLRQTLARHRGWTPAWRDAAPKSGYDVIIVGGGGHGLAAAYYLAKVHGITNVAVLEKHGLGSGNVGRNTTIIRSNYLLPGNNPFYEWSLKLWEGLEQDINYNAMVSQRGVLNLYHSDAQRDAYARLVFGGDIDGYNSYAQRGNLPTVEHVCESGMALIPSLGRVRMLRSWGGIMDMSMDGSPIIDRTPIDGLYLNAGWCYGGFKATPASGWCFAHLLANDQAYPLARAYRLDRFASGHLIDENGQGAQPNLH